MTRPEEEWRYIPGYGDWYEVSNLGRVRSWRKMGGWPGRPHNPRLLSGTLHGSARSGHAPGPKYRNFTVRADNEVEGVARSGGLLALLAFVGPPPTPSHECGRKNGNASDDRLVNLEWRTPQGHADSRGARGTTVRGSRHKGGLPRGLTDDQVRDVRTSAKAGLSVKEIAAKLPVSCSVISRILRGKTYKNVK